MSLSDAAASGDLRTALEATRDHLAGLLEEAGARDGAALARELRAVLLLLDKLEAGGEESPLDRIAATVDDELSRRRSARLPDAAGS